MYIFTFSFIIRFFRQLTMRTARFFTFTSTGFHYNDDSPKVVYSSAKTHILFVSSAIPYYPSFADKKRAYDKTFILYGAHDDKGKIVVKSRRGVCTLCKTNLKLEELHHIKDHIKKLHPNLLALDDYPKDSSNDLQTQYEEALTLKSKNILPSYCSNTIDGRSKKRLADCKLDQFGILKKARGEDFGDVFSTGIALGGLPASLADNKGIQHIVQKALGVSKMPDGTSARTVARRCLSMYSEKLQEKAGQLRMWTACQSGNYINPYSSESDSDGISRSAIATNPTTASVPSRILHLMHDSWTARFNKASLTAVKTSLIDSSNKVKIDGVEVQKLRLRTMVIAMTPVTEGHAASATEQLIDSGLNEFCYGRHNVCSSTADTTGSAKNVYKDEDGIENIDCFAHLCNLFLKHSLEGEIFRNGKFKKQESQIKDCLEAIHEVSVKLSSSKNSLELLFAQQKIIDPTIKKVLTAKCHFPVRWNSYEKSLSRFKEIRNAVVRIPTASLFPNDHGAKKLEKIKHYECNLNLINDGLPLVLEFHGFMTKMAQWTQVLSSNTAVTISKVLVALQDIKYQLGMLRARALELNVGRKPSEGVTEIIPDPATRETSKYMLRYIKIFEDNLDHYFGETYCKRPIFQTSSYLDPSTWSSLSVDALDVTIAAAYMETFCSDDERTTPAANESDAMHSDDDCPAFAALNTEQLSHLVQQRSPLQKELAAFNTWVRKNYRKAERVSLDPLEFYARQSVQKLFPIHYRTALILLGAQATSADVERFFSTSGRIFSVARASLKAETGSVFATLKSWLSDEIDDESRRSRVMTASTKRFATLVASNKGLLTVNPGMESNDYFNEEEELNMEDEATLQQRLLDKPPYEGEIEPCPAFLPSGLNEGDRVAVYFVDKNLWYAGKMYHVNKRRKLQDNVAVLFDDGSNHHFCWSNITQYGVEKEFVILPPTSTTVEAIVNEFDDGEEY